MNKNKTNRKGGIWLFIIIALACIVLTILLINFLGGKPDVLDQQQMANIVQNGDLQLGSVTVETNGVHLTIKGVYALDGKLHEFVFRGYSDEYFNWLLQHDPTSWVHSLGNYSVVPIARSFWDSFGPTLLSFGMMIILYIFIFWFLMRGMSGQMGGGAASPFGMAKNKARLVKSTTRFSDVAGIDEEKGEVQELVDYLKNPKKYEDVGARAPKGVLLEGPPGTKNSWNV